MFACIHIYIESSLGATELVGLLTQSAGFRVKNRKIFVQQELTLSIAKKIQQITEITNIDQNETPNMAADSSITLRVELHATCGRRV